MTVAYSPLTPTATLDADGPPRSLGVTTVLSVCCELVTSSTLFARQLAAMVSALFVCVSNVEVYVRQMTHSVDRVTAPSRHSSHMYYNIVSGDSRLQCVRLC